MEEVSPGRPAVEPGELRPDGSVEARIPSEMLQVMSFLVLEVFGNPRNPETMEMLRRHKMTWFSKSNS